ncbi:unnamed protein product [Mytilus coruscus]|uniref:Uncharacterized protein n=1 Tax=Mytilus coruscus TaxID=42192 RepID=A0A6J8BZI4_MYTCO|nr:unnamed protein product [Mytilus coruscus]
MIGVCTGVILLLFSDVASDLRRCPYGTHKRIRAQWKCVRPVYKGNIDAEKCAVDNFSPGSIKSNENDKCTFIKSLCTEEGQLAFKNGSTETDRSCRCDYRKGYDFIIAPINSCTCIPFDEDCSCYKKKCRDSSQVLTPDYICTQGYNDSDAFRCPRITNAE